MQPSNSPAVSSTSGTAPIRTIGTPHINSAPDQEYSPRTGYGAPEPSAIQLQVQQGATANEKQWQNAASGSGTQTSSPYHRVSQVTVMIPKRTGRKALKIVFLVSHHQPLYKCPLLPHLVMHGWRNRQHTRPPLEPHGFASRTQKVEKAGLKGYFVDFVCHSDAIGIILRLLRRGTSKYGYIYFNFGIISRDYEFSTIFYLQSPSSSPNVKLKITGLPSRPGAEVQEVRDVEQMSSDSSNSSDSSDDEGASKKTGDSNKS